VDDGPLRYRPLSASNPGQIADVLEWISYASGYVPRLTKKYFGRDQSIQQSGHGTSFPVLPVVW